MTFQFPPFARRPVGALMEGDVFTCLYIGKGKYLVVSAQYGGGSTGHDPFPDGWEIEYIPLSPSALLSPLGIAQALPRQIKKFHQSGCFNDIVHVDSIEIIGCMKETRSWNWTKFPNSKPKKKGKKNG